MTAFASKECDTEWGRLTWELRTVNHRYMELSPRLPEEFRILESLLRDKAKQRVRRGKLDAVLRFQHADSVQGGFTLDVACFRSLLKTLADVEGELKNPNRVNALEVMRWPGVLQTPRIDNEGLHAAVVTLFEQALVLLEENRMREGQVICDLLLARCDGLVEQAALARQRYPEVMQGVRAKLLQRVEALRADPDQDRLEQELVYLAQKMDIDEELDRLDAHLDETQRVLGLDEPVGRRLDFLMQELNREVNTLASKSADRQLTHTSVEMKVLVEQMREQIQNVE